MILISAFKDNSVRVLKKKSSLHTKLVQRHAHNTNLQLEN